MCGDKTSSPHSTEGMHSHHWRITRTNQSLFNSKPDFEVDGGKADKKHILQGCDNAFYHDNVLPYSTDSGVKLPSGGVLGHAHIGLKVFILSNAA